MITSTTFLLLLLLLLSSFSFLALAQKDCTGDSGIGFPFPGNKCCIGLLATSDDNEYVCHGTLVPFSDPHYSAIVSSAEAGRLPTSTISTAGTIGPIGTAATTGTSSRSATALSLTTGPSVQTMTTMPTSTTTNGASPTKMPDFGRGCAAVGVAMAAVAMGAM